MAMTINREVSYKIPSSREFGFVSRILLSAFIAIWALSCSKVRAQSPQTIGAANITVNSASLLGYIITSGSTVFFEYGLANSSLVNSTTHVHISNTGTHQALIYNLTPKTKYRFRIVEYPDYYSPSAGSFLTFTTASLPPTTTTRLASYINSDGATLNGTVNPNGTKSYGYFEFGTTSSYGSKTPQVNLYSGTNAVAIFQTVGGFNSGTICHFRAVGVNSNLQYSYGRDFTFTCAVPPVATTIAASGVGNSMATLHGTVNPKGTSTSAIFEYGLTTGYGSKITNATALTGNSAIVQQITLTGLKSSSTYHFRMAGRNNISQYGYGADLIFTTACTNTPMFSTMPADQGTNNFGFSVNWGSGRMVIVDACTNLANPIWIPLQTNTLIGNSLDFNDPKWTNYIGRFYRIRSP